MISPIDLLKGIRRVADIVYIWSHYYDAARAKNRIEFDELKNITYSEFSRSIHLHHRNYPDQGDGSFFSGENQTYSYWMEKDDIIFVLSELGYGRIELLGDEPDYPPGPAFGLLARTS